MNLRDNIKRILREEIKQNMGIHEVFDEGQMPELLRKVKKEGKVIYQYSLPSKKSDENYYINLTFYKNFDEFKLKDVLDLDFDLGESGEKKYSGLNEIFYLFTSINKVIEKHKKDFRYLVIFSSQDRLSLYEKVLSRIDYLNLDKKGGNFILYKNNDYSKWF